LVPQHKTTQTQLVARGRESNQQVEESRADEERERAGTHLLARAPREENGRRRRRRAERGAYGPSRAEPARRGDGRERTRLESLGGCGWLRTGEGRDGLGDRREASGAGDVRQAVRERERERERFLSWKGGEARRGLRRERRAGAGAFAVWEGGKWEGRHREAGGRAASWAPPSNYHPLLPQQWKRRWRRTTTTTRARREGAGLD
jgi:hypothetical protein